MLSAPAKFALARLKSLTGVTGSEERWLRFTTRSFLLFSVDKSHPGEGVDQKRQAEGGSGGVVEEGQAHRGAGVGADPAGEDFLLESDRHLCFSFPGHFLTSVSWQLSTGRWRREEGR